jgi:hypothetical protein
VIDDEFQRSNGSGIEVSGAGSVGVRAGVAVGGRVRGRGKVYEGKSWQSKEALLLATVVPSCYRYQYLRLASSALT